MGYAKSGLVVLIFMVLSACLLWLVVPRQATDERADTAAPQAETHTRVNDAWTKALGSKSPAPAQTDDHTGTTNARVSKGWSDVLGTRNAAPAKTPATAVAGDEQIARLIKEGKAREYTRCVAQDQALGIEAARTLIPAGWTCQAEVDWNMQSNSTPAMIRIFAQSPDKKANVLFISRMAFEEPLIQQMPYLNIPRAQLYQEGMYTERANPILRFMSPENFSVYILQKTYGGLGNIRVLDAHKYTPEEREALDKANAQQFASLTQGIPPGSGGHVRSTTLDWGMVEISAMQNNKSYKCTVLSSIASQTIGSNQEGYVTESIYWSASPIIIYTAESDAHKSNKDAIDIFNSNMIINQQWLGSVVQAIKVIGQRRVDVINKRGEEIRRQIILQAQATSRQANQDYSGSIKNRADSNSRVMAGWTDAIVGEDKYRGPDGGVVKMDMHYDNAYAVPGTNTIIGTKGITLDPNKYQQLQKLPNVLPKGY